jgi:hypothetical protein
MKSIIKNGTIAMFILCVNAMMAHAQNKPIGYGSSATWELGIYGGYGYSNYSGDVSYAGTGAESYNNLTSWSGGMRYIYLFHPNFGGSIDLRYQKKGSSYQNVGEEFIENTRVEMNYLEVPISFVMQGNSSSSVIPFAHVGVFGAHLIDANSKNSVVHIHIADSVFSDYSINVTNRYGKWDYGANLGAGVKWSVGPKMLMWIELQYHQGLADIDTQTELFTRNMNVNLNVGLAWRE